MTAVASCGSCPLKGIHFLRHSNFPGESWQEGKCLQELLDSWEDHAFDLRLNGLLLTCDA